MTTTSDGGLGDQLLGTVEGAAFLACAAAVGRLEEALADRGSTLCLAAHALGEVRRGTDGGRLRSFVEDPGAWLRVAAASVDAAAVDWWSTPTDGRVLRQIDPSVAGVEVHDARGRPRSTVEEAAAHLYTFSSRDRSASPRRFVLTDGADVLRVDGPADVDDDVRQAVEPTAATGAPGVHLTLRGALTVPRSSLPHWPWEVAGVHWVHGVPPDAIEEVAVGPEPRVVHDHAWPPIGRPYDPRFDEGDEVDGSEIVDAG